MSYTKKLFYRVPAVEVSRLDAEKTVLSDSGKFSIEDWDEEDLEDLYA